MELALPLEQMTTAEKLRAMESLWADLSRQADNVPCPAWHQEVLREREESVAQGLDQFEEWETAKAHIRKSIK